MASVRFFINNGKSQKATIQCQITCSSGKKSFSTKMKVPRNMWDAKRQTVSGRRLTNELEEVRAKIDAWHNYVPYELEDDYAGIDIDSIIDRVFFPEDGANENSLTITGLVDEKINRQKEASLATIRTLHSIKFKILSAVSEIGLSNDLLDLNQEWIDDFTSFIRRDCLEPTVMTYATMILAVISDKKKKIKKKDKKSELENYLLSIDLDISEIRKGFNEYQSRKKEKEYLSIEDIEFLFSIKDEFKGSERDALFAYIAAFFTGLRYSELAERSLHDVFSKLNIDGNEYFYMKYDSKKNKSSNIHTAFHPFLIEIMEEYRKDSRVVKRKHYFGGEMVETTLEIKSPIFPGANYLKTYSAWKKLLKKIVKTYPDKSEFLSREVRVNDKNGIRYVPRHELLTMHTARHGFGAFMLKSGFSMAQVSKMLGHKNISTTEKWYQHLDFEDAAISMAKIFKERTDLLKKQREDTTPPRKQKNNAG